MCTVDIRYMIYPVGTSYVRSIMYMVGNRYEPGRIYPEGYQVFTRYSMYMVGTK